MSHQPDENFFDRADDIIRLANEQTAEASYGEVSASCLYAVARFNAFASTIGYESAEKMKADKAGAIMHLIEQYRAMLDENFDDFIEHFQSENAKR